MNFEIIMLRNASRMKKNALAIAAEAKKLALGSYDTFNWRNGTMGQMMKVAQLAQKREKYDCFWMSVVRALNGISSCDRVLLVQIYFKHRSKQEIAKKYGASLSTVYRRVKDALRRFGSQLALMGCNEQWLAQNFPDFDWVRTCAQE